MRGPLTGPHGGYRDLKAYQLAEIIYDGTVAFTRIYLDKRSRTVDQMIQAARSGKQNIAEGNRASATSKKSELTLINVARSSLEELLLDFEDFLRQHGHEQWDKGHVKARYIARLRHGETDEDRRSDRSDRSDQSDRKTTAYDTYRVYVEAKGAENSANTLITLIHQANFLLDRYLLRLQKDFAANGGFSERLYQVRSKARLESREQDVSLADRTDRTAPTDLTEENP